MDWTIDADDIFAEEEFPEEVRSDQEERLKDEIIKHTDSGDAAKELLRTFERVRSKDRLDHATEVAKAHEEAYELASKNLLKYVGEYEAEMISTSLQLMRDSKDPETGKIDIDKLNKRLGAMKLGQKAGDSIKANAIEKKPQKIEIDVVHRMDELANELESGIIDAEVVDE